MKRKFASAAATCHVLPVKVWEGRKDKKWVNKNTCKAIWKGVSKGNRGTSNSDPLEECQLKCQRYVNDFAGKVRSSFPRVWWKLFEVVKSAKILGVTVREDLKWNEHIDIITVKASEAHGCWQSITDLMFLSCIKSVLKYACQSFHSSLPAY